MRSLSATLTGKSPSMNVVKYPVPGLFPLRSTTRTLLTGEIEINDWGRLLAND